MRSSPGELSGEKLLTLCYTNLVDEDVEDVYNDDDDDGDDDGGDDDNDDENYDYGRYLQCFGFC